MRPTPRTSLLALTLAVLALLAAGCGADEVPADEVSGAPPALIVPSDSELGAAGSSADASEDATAEEDADADAAAGAAETDSSGTVAPAAPEDTSGGTAAPTTETAPEDTTTEEQPPAAGSPPEQFESFCEQNAGAC